VLGRSSSAAGKKEQLGVEKHMHVIVVRPP